MKTLNEAITQHAFFTGMKPEHLGVLTEDSRIARFNAGDLLFREREPVDQFHLIESGKIALEAHEPTDGTMPVQTPGPGNVLGWSWLFPPFAWQLEARAIEPASVIVLSGAHLLVIAERDHDFGYELMKRAAQIVPLPASRRHTRRLPALSPARKRSTL